MSEFITDATFALKVVSAEGQIFSSEVSMVVVPSAAGVIGIMPHHAPLLATLKPGEMRIVLKAREDEFLYVSGGYVEVQPTQVTVLADTAVRGDDVDEAAALEAKKRAEEIIRTAHLFTDRDKAQVELLKALAQLKALEHAQRRKTRGF